MSRYVAVALELHSLDEVAVALRSLGLAFERGRDRVMLEGSLECAGEPVDIRLHAGTLDSVEDFGFAHDDGSVRLVCGELDGERLQQDLVPKLRAAIVEQRVRASGLRVERVEQGQDGVTRIVVTED